MAQLIAKRESEPSANCFLHAEEVAPGIFALKTTATLSGSISIGNVDVAVCEDDAQKTTPYSNGAVADLSVDKNGRLWIVPQDVENAIMNAGDVQKTIAYNGTTDEIDYILYVSARWNALMGFTKRVRKNYDWDTYNRLVGVQVTLEDIP